jgi:hypothetical protein
MLVSFSWQGDTLVTSKQRAERAKGANLCDGISKTDPISRIASSISDSWKRVIGKRFAGECSHPLMTEDSN